MLQAIPEQKGIFDKCLKERYDAEFGETRMWNGHREWWLSDIGPGHDYSILEFLTDVSGFTRGWRNKLCVDLGCGSGSGLIALKALFADGIGLELEMAGSDLKLSRARTAMYGFDKLTLLNADGTKAPFKDCKFDIALSFCKRSINHIFT